MATKVTNKQNELKLENSFFTRLMERVNRLSFDPKETKDELDLSDLDRDLRTLREHKRQLQVADALRFQNYSSSQFKM